MLLYILFKVEYNISNLVDGLLNRTVTIYLIQVGHLNRKGK